MNKLSIFFTGIIAVTIVVGIIASGELVEGAPPNTGTSMKAKVLGTLTCPDMTVHTGYDFFLAVTNGVGALSGSLTGVPAISGSGPFVGELTTNDFAYSTIIVEETCAGQSGAGIATVATISGTCGVAGTFNFATNTGVTGTFTGKVACI